MKLLPAISPKRGLPVNHDLLPTPSLLPPPSSSSPMPPISIPHTLPSHLPNPTLTNVLHNRNQLLRTTCSQTNSVPSKPFHHYNNIDPINLFISLNTILNITPPTTPDPSILHTSLLHDCFLSAPLPFLWNCSWDLNKPPNSYHEALNQPDNSVWLAAMQREYESLESRKAFERTTLPPGRKAIGVCWTFNYKYHPDGSILYILCRMFLLLFSVVTFS